MTARRRLIGLLVATLIATGIIPATQHAALAAGTDCATSTAEINYGTAQKNTRANVHLDLASWEVVVEIKFYNATGGILYANSYLVGQSGQHTITDLTSPALTELPVNGATRITAAVVEAPLPAGHTCTLAATTGGAIDSTGTDPTGAVQCANEGRIDHTYPVTYNNFHVTLAAQLRFDTVVDARMYDASGTQLFRDVYLLRSTSPPTLKLPPTTAGINGVASVAISVAPGNLSAIGSCALKAPTGTKVAPTPLRLTRSFPTTWAAVTKVDSGFDGKVSVSIDAPAPITVCAACRSSSLEDSYAEVGTDLPAGTSIAVSAVTPTGTVSSSDSSRVRVTRWNAYTNSWQITWDLDGNGTKTDMTTVVYGLKPLDPDSRYWSPSSTPPPHDGAHPGWSQSDLDLTYSVQGNPTLLSYNLGHRSRPRDAVVHRAFDEISRNLAQFGFKQIPYNPKGPKADIQIRFSAAPLNSDGHPDLASTDIDCGYGPNICYPGGTIKSALVKINTGQLYTTETQRWAGGLGRVSGDARYPYVVDPRLDVESVLLHELMHAIGAQHSYDLDDVMFWLYDYTKRILTPNDIAQVVVK